MTLRYDKHFRKVAGTKSIAFLSINNMLRKKPGKNTILNRQKKKIDLNEPNRGGERPL
jgi:hypothetical protein